MEGENKETKITSVEKEKVKDPRRVEQEKKLAAISREAKERKAKDRAQRLTEEAEQQREAEAGSFTPYVFVIPAIGAALGGYYLSTSTALTTERKGKNHRRKEKI